MPPPQFLITYLIFEWQQKMVKSPIKAGRFIDGATLRLEDLKMKLLPAIIILAATISLSKGQGALVPLAGKSPLGLFNTVGIFMGEGR